MKKRKQISHIDKEKIHRRADERYQIYYYIDKQEDDKEETTKYDEEKSP